MTFLEQLKADHGRKLMIGGHRGHLSEVRENTIENYKQILGSGISHAGNRPSDGGSAAEV